MPPPWPEKVAAGPQSTGWSTGTRSCLPPPPPEQGLAPLPTTPVKPALRDVAAAGALLVLSAGMHVAAMFPPYSGNPATSVVSTPYQMAVYICLGLGWTLAGLLVLTRLTVRGGVALGAGLGLVELGFLMTDLAGSLQVSARSTPGIWLAFAALAVGGAGVLLGASVVPMGGPRLRPYDEALRLRAFVTVLVSLLAVAAFVPSWDSYQFVTAAGRTATITLGNAFAQPAGVMAGELVAALAIGLVPILGAFWAPPAVGNKKPHRRLGGGVQNLC